MTSLARLLHSPIVGRSALPAALVAALLAGTPVAVAQIDPPDRFWTHAERNELIDDVDTLISRTDSIPGGFFSNLPGVVRNQLGVGLDTSTKNRILEAFQDAQEAFADQAAQAAEIATFGNGDPGTPCFDFRQNLLTLLGAMRDIVDAQLESTPLSDLEIDFDALTGAIENLPCAVLFPASRVFFGVSETASFSVELAAAGDTANEIGGAVPNCVDVAGQQARYRAAGAALLTGAKISTLISAALHTDNVIAKGPFVFRPRTDKKAIGVHGYANLMIERPKFQNLFSTAFATLGELLDGTSTFVFNRVRHCEILVGQEGILTRVGEAEAILLAEIFATETRLSAQHAAIEALLLEERRRREEWQAFDLEMRIGESLAHRGESDVVALQIPAAFGGLLETVGTVVEVAIAQKTAAGARVQKADRDWRRGNDKLAANRFREAYDHYAKAYRRLADADEDSDSR